MPRLHLGCGLNTPPGWIHVDGSWNAWLAKYPRLRSGLRLLHLLPPHADQTTWNPEIVIHDLRRPLPFPDNSMSAVYSSNLLEHFYLKEAEALLAECRRVLMPGGIVRMVVPDLRVFVLEYLGERLLPHTPEELKIMPPADRLNHRLLFRRPAPPSGNILYRLYTALTEFHNHKWMYDVDSLAFHLREAGFQEVKVMGFQESRIADIAVIEVPPFTSPEVVTAVEGEKPSS